MPGQWKDSLRIAASTESQPIKGRDAVRRPSPGSKGAGGGHSCLEGSANGAAPRSIFLQGNTAKDASGHDVGLTSKLRGG